jgi:hypothetical protein
MGMIPRMVINHNNDTVSNNDLGNRVQRRRRWNVHTLNKDPEEQPSNEAINGDTDTIYLGGDKDEHGCIPSAGFTWCEQLHTCIQPWVTICPSSVIP